MHLRFRRKEPSFWKDLLGYQPKNLALYQLALTHKSATRGGNERLEFLGDAVLSLVIAEQLYVLFPAEQEGTLTRMRSKIVCRENMNHLALEMELHAYLRLGQTLKANAENVYGNALEALIGAIYLDAGQQQAKRFVLRYFVGENQQILYKLLTKESDFKSRLLEWGQAHHQSIEFVQCQDRYEPTADQHTFVYAVRVNGKEIAQAAGHTKLIAQQNSAKKALQNVKKMNKR